MGRGEGQIVPVHVKEDNGKHACRGQGGAGAAESSLTVASHPWLPAFGQALPCRAVGGQCPRQPLTLLVFSEPELSLLLHNVVLLSTNYLETRR